MRPSTSVIKQWGRIEVLETLQIDASWREATYPYSGSAAEAPNYDGSCQEELRVVVLVSDGAASV